jgi:L-2-hydroxyglutarate oxidase LhgO
MRLQRGDLENAGGVIAFNSPVVHAKCAAKEIQLTTKDETKLIARTVINSTGLATPSLAKEFIGLDESCIPQAYYAKGNYFTLKGKAPFSHLIYPVPSAAGLGVHLTLDLGGQAKFGSDVEWVDSPYELTVNPQRGEDFYAEVRKFWPALKDHALQPGYAGIRPKINDRIKLPNIFVFRVRYGMEFRALLACSA